MREFYKVSDDVMRCAISDIEQGYSRNMAEDCIFWGLYESKYGKSLSIAEMWNENRDIDYYLAIQSESMIDDIFSGKYYENTETGEIITETQLISEFQNLQRTEPETYNYTFYQYLMNCLSKNGTLMEV